MAFEKAGKMYTANKVSQLLSKMENLTSFTDILGDEIPDSQQSQPMSLPSTNDFDVDINEENTFGTATKRPAKGTGQYEQFRSVEEIDPKYRGVFTYPYFNLVQSSVIEDAIYSDKSMVVCAPTGSGKTVIFEMAIVQLLMYLEDKHYTDDFKIIYMAPVKALCTERLTEWYPKFTKLGLLCIVVTGDTDVDFSQLKPYRIIITTPEKWDMLTRRWRDHRSLVEVIKLFLIDEVHILNDESRGPALEVVVSRMKTIESSAQSAYRIEQLQKKYQGSEFVSKNPSPRIRFVAVSATVGNPEDVASWIGDADNPAVFYKFGDECRPVKLKRVVEGYPCSEGTSIFKFDIILNYKLWPIIQKYHNGKPTLIFCNTRKSVVLTAEMLSREITINFSPDQKAQLTALASTLKNKKLQCLILSGVGCHHAGLLFEERTYIEQAFRNRDLPILITTTTLAMGVNLPAHLVIIKNTQQYVNGAYQEYSISTVLQMVGRAGRPQYDTEATAVIMTRLADKFRYQALVGGSEPLQSYLHKRLPENLNSEAALGTVTDVAQCVQWLRSTFLWVRARRDPKRYLGLPITASQELITKKIEELCVKAMNGLASTGLITMDEASCIESTEAGRLMSVYYIDLETMKHIMKIEGNETLERLLCILCESHELADMHLRMDERRCLNALNRNSTSTTIRFPMKGKITTRQMKLNCIIQAILGCLPIPDPSLNQEAMKIMRVADRICKCLVAYVTRPGLISQEPQFFSVVLNSLVLAKCISAQLWENSPFLSRQLKGIGPTLSALLASAGKVNFFMLKESHPRDLERIMNKGPPAGNVLLKQVCLLPKYHLIATPEDEKTVNIQLVMQNQSYLADNLDHLTAGDAHKCYIVVGDSENYILLLTSIKDKDLINIYVGNITYKITRKHDFEHKIYAYCISTNFVGIDDHCEHIFQDLRPTHSRPHEDTPIRSTQKKQTLITDNFNERKRKNQKNITELKEKKRRESTIIEKFKCLKESLRVPSKKLKENCINSTEISDKVLPATTVHCDKNAPNHVIINSTKIVDDKNNTSSTQILPEDSDPDPFVDDNKINCLLDEIESEILKHGKKPTTSDISSQSFALNSPDNFIKDTKAMLTDSKEKYQKINLQSTEQLMQHKHKKQNVTRNQRNLKTNFSFIDLLEKNISFSDDEEKIYSNDDVGFSNAIKSRIDNYLIKTKCNATDSNVIVNKMLKTSGDTEIPRKGSREFHYGHSSDNVDNIYKEISIDDVLNINNNEIVNQVGNKDDKISNIIDYKEKERMKLENIPCHDIPQSYSYNEQTQNIVIPSDNVLDISNNDKNNNNNHNNNEIVCLKQDFQQTPKSNSSIVSPFCFIKTGNNEKCKETYELNNTINYVTCFQKVDNQPNNNKKKIINNPRELTKKFTCTSTEIDVCTKSTNDQIIHVVRKLRVDLDYTEAVYISNNSNIKQENHKEKINEVIVIPNSKHSPIKTKFLSNGKVHKIDETNNIKDYKLEEFNITNNLHHIDEPIEQVRLCKKHENLNNLAIEKKMCQNVTKTESNFELGVSINAAVCKLPMERLQSDLHFIHMENNYDHCKNETCNNKITKCKNTGKIEELQTIRENNTISDILQKYSKLSQNNHYEREPANRSLITFTDVKDNVIETKTTRKPFNILDINNVNVSLPNILVDVIPTQNLPISKFPVEDTSHDEERYKNEDRPLLTPTVLNEEYLNFKIDPSMFDPKTLLLCLENENNDEIIPPPLEYRDKSVNNTPQDIDGIECNFNEFNQKSHDSPQTLNMSEIDNMNKEISTDKMESWVLSREESQEDYGSFSLKQDIVMPYTVKRVKSPENNWINQNNTLLEHTLQQFKFNHKGKMKMNRDLR